MLRQPRAAGSRSLLYQHQHLLLIVIYAWIVQAQLGALEVLPELRLIHFIEVLDAGLVLVRRGRRDVTDSLQRLESFCFGWLRRLCGVRGIVLGLEDLIFDGAFGFTTRCDAAVDALFLVVGAPRVRNIQPSSFDCAVVLRFNIIFARRQCGRLRLHTLHTSSIN